jgi:hypothetical protein
MPRSLCTIAPSPDALLDAVADTPLGKPLALCTDFKQEYDFHNDFHTALRAQQHKLVDMRRPRAASSSWFVPSGCLTSASSSTAPADRLRLLNTCAKRRDKVT